MSNDDDPYRGRQAPIDVQSTERCATENSTVDCVYCAKARVFDPKLSNPLKLRKKLLRHKRHRALKVEVEDIGNILLGFGMK